MSVTLVSASGVSVRLGGSEVLRGISLSVEAGEIITVIGPNGSGKSTLLRALLGMVPVTAGRVWRRPRLRIGYVPQRLTIDASLPLAVRRFLSLPRRVSGAQVQHALARVGMEGGAALQMATLSGGEMQRVLLARALLSRPELLVLDEPTQGLDAPGEAGFYRLIAELRAELGCAVIMVSHDLHVVMAASDRVICLNRHICCEGTPEAVSSAPQYHALFGAAAAGTLALYRHEHDHSHDHLPGHGDGGSGSEGRDRSHGHDHEGGAHGAA